MKKNHKDTKQDTRFTKALAGSWDGGTDGTDLTDDHRFATGVREPRQRFATLAAVGGKDGWLFDAEHLPNLKLLNIEPFIPSAKTSVFSFLCGERSVGEEKVVFISMIKGVVCKEL